MTAGLRSPAVLILAVACILNTSCVRSTGRSLDVAIAEIEAGLATAPLIEQPAPGAEASVTFLVKSEGDQTPRIVSDVTGWGESPDDSFFDVTIGTMARVDASDWYSLQTRVAPGARIEYLVVHGETDYQVDPSNPRRAWSRGGHDISEFVVPDWAPPPELTGPAPDPAGRTTEGVINSRALGTPRRALVYLPPGNIAVSETGRIFFSFHPEARPGVNVAEWVNGEAVPYPAVLPNDLAYQSVLSLRIDLQNRLWILDNANHGTGTPRIIAIDLVTDEVVHRHDFPSAIAGIGSHLNDFQVSPDGTRIYIADASIFRQNPALVVYDVESKRARRVLEGHPSVTPDPYVPVVQGRKMTILGIFAVRPGVDSIALDRTGEWLYFAPVTDDHMHRIRRADLDDERLSPGELAQRVEKFALKTMSDGITTDLDGNIYLSDADQSAIVVLEPFGTLRTLIKDPMLRWPDGFSFGPDGYLYVTCSALHEVIMRSRSHVTSKGPYQIYRFRPGPTAPPGH